MSSSRTTATTTTTTTSSNSNSSSNRNQFITAHWISISRFYMQIVYCPLFSIRMSYLNAPTVLYCTLQTIPSNVLLLITLLTTPFLRFSLLVIFLLSSTKSPSLACILRTNNFRTKSQLINIRPEWFVRENWVLFTN